MVAFITANLHMLMTVLLGVLVVISEIMGLSKSSSSAKGVIDGFIKFLQNDPNQPKL